MTQAIDPIKLKATAEHLEWVLKQYPESENVKALLHGLLPLIEDAKSSNVKNPVDNLCIPFIYSFTDGLYTQYKEPSVGSAYADFVTEIGGGLTEQDKKRRAEMEAYRKSLLETIR